MRYISRLMALLVALPLLASCQLLSPGEVKNPNVEENDFVNAPNAMRTWVNGTNARFAAALSRLSENLEILSDNIYNNSSRSNKTWDKLEIFYTDGELRSISTCIGEMIEMTSFGLNTIAHKDAATTAAQCFNLSYVRICAFLMASENFIALPASANGQVLQSSELAELALQEVAAAAQYATEPQEKALLSLLEARAHRLLGNLSLAEGAAREATVLAPQLLYQAKFDDLNGITNTVQSFVAQELFTIHPRLAAQRAKCPQVDLYNQPIAFAKSEEAWLILAEVKLKEHVVDNAVDYLHTVIDLAAQRPASVSIVTVSHDDIDAAQTEEQLMALVYRLRQEVFFAEGRRASDLGFRLPISEVEFHQQGNLPQSYTQPHIPGYIQALTTPLDDVYDINPQIVPNFWH